MSSLTFFFILLPILAIILLAINILLFSFKSENYNSSKLYLNSSSNLLILLRFMVWSHYLYYSIHPTIYNEIIFTTSSYIIDRITIDLQPNNLDPYLLDCIYRELLFHIKCNYLYLNGFLSKISGLKVYSLEYISAMDTYYLANKNLENLHAFLENVKTQQSIYLNR